MTEHEQRRLAAQVRARRNDVERLAEVRGWIGRHRAPHQRVALRTADGVRLAATWLPGPTADAPAVVLAHGFAAHRRKPAYAFLADVLAGSVHVLSIDLRGHGGSRGRCALGGHEWQDVTAAIDAMRRRGHETVVPIGLSMGGASTLHALARGASADAAVVISTAGWHGDLRLDAMRKLDSLWRTRWKRVGWQLVAGFRMLPPAEWEPYPDPADLAERSGVPLLVIHGADDAYFPREHAEALRDAARGRAVLWDEPEGFGHAEDGITPAFCARLARAVLAVARDGRFPKRDEA